MTLEYHSEFGHFSADGREFVITDWRTPRPWSNLIANRRYDPAGGRSTSDLPQPFCQGSVAV